MTDNIVLLERTLHKLYFKKFSFPKQSAYTLSLIICLAEDEQDGKTKTCSN